MARASRTGVSGLYRGADGRFFLDYRWKDASTGKARRYRRKLDPGTPAVRAKAWARERIEGLLSGTFDPDRAEPEGLRAAFDAYLAHLETRGLASVGSRRGHADLWCELLGANRAVDSLTGADVRRFQDARRKAGKAPATVNRGVATAKAFAKWARDAGLLSAGAAAEVRAVPLLREPPGRVRFLSEPEEARLLAALDAELGRMEEELRPVVLTAILSGMRRSELVSLRRSQVDLPRRSIVLSKTKSNRARVLPIDDTLAALIEALPTDDDSTSYVFRLSIEPPRAGVTRSEDARRADKVSKAFARIVKTAKITSLRLHDLRHDFATRVRRAGGGLDVIQRLLGHSTIAMSTRYAHVGDEAMRAAVEAMAKPGAKR